MKEHILSATLAAMLIFNTAGAAIFALEEETLVANDSAGAAQTQCVCSVGCSADTINPDCVVCSAPNGDLAAVCKPAPAEKASRALGTWDGTGHEATPYLIADAADLSKLAADVTGGNDYSGTFFKLTGDIGTVTVPIGASDKKFEGTFDGGGYEVALFINDQSKTHQALFGFIGAGGTVKNLGVTGSVRGKGNIAGLAGTNEGAIENCYNKADATVVSQSYCGGIAGLNKGTISDCYNEGTINGRSSTGGLAGTNGFAGENAAITTCYNAGPVTGNTGTGGITGSNAARIESCFNTETIRSLSYVGGVAGDNSSYSASIENCYNTGEIIARDGSNKAAGGVVGLNGSNYGYFLLKNCYNTGNVGGVSMQRVGGIAGTNDLGGNVIGCIALGLSATSGDTDIGRVVGINSRSNVSSGTLSGNKGRGDMELNAATVSGGAENDINGETVALGNATQDVVFSGWGDEWDIPDGVLGEVSLPTLKGFPIQQRPELPGGTVNVTVTVGPASPNVQKGTTQQFSAVVTGTSYMSVTWGVAGGSAGTSIDSGGLLTVAADETAESLTVTATSEFKPSAKGAATVTLTDIPVTKYSVTVTGGTGSGSYEEGEGVAVKATPADGKFFTNWTAEGLTLSPADKTADPLTFIMPANAVTVTAVFADNGAGNPTSGGSSRSGSSGSTAIKRRIVPGSNVEYWGDGKVIENVVADQTAKAIAEAKKAGGTEASIAARNPVYVAPKTLQEMALAADKAGGTVILMADSVVDGTVMVRIYLDPASGERRDNLLLGGWVDEKAVKATKAKFSNFDNRIAVISLAQQGEFGMNVEVAAKLNLAGFDTAYLHFYSYDKADNSYQPIAAPSYRIDSTGYLHFDTRLAGDIIVTDRPLTKK